MKDIFFEILEKSDINPFKKSFLKINVKEVIFEPSPSLDYEELKEGKKDFRHYDIYLVVEKKWKAYTEQYIKQAIKPLMTEAFKKKLCCDSVSFGILEKETYDKVRTCIGLEPIDVAAKKGKEITDRVNNNINAMSEK